MFQCNSGVPSTMVHPIFAVLESEKFTQGFLWTGQSPSKRQKREYTHKPENARYVPQKVDLLPRRSLNSQVLQ